MGSQMKFLFPEKFSLALLGKRMWREISGQPNDFDDPLDLVHIKLLDPVKASELRFNKHYLLKSLKESRDQEDWHDFATYAEALKILAPEEFRTRSDCDTTAWKKMRDELYTLRNEGKIVEFFEMAASMKMLAAEEIKIYDTRIEIIMPKPKREFQAAQETSFPKIKKF